MNNKQNNNWQAKEDLAEHLYGLDDAVVESVNTGTQITFKRRAMAQIKHNGKPIKATNQWDNQR